MLVHQHDWRVRYGDTDKMGYLYYGHYAKLYEIGRSEMIRDLGLSYREMEDELKVMMPVLSLQSRYRLPAKYDDILTIETKLEAMPTKMITFEHRVLRNEEILNTGKVKLFFIDMTSQKRVSCPAYLASKLTTHFE